MKAPANEMLADYASGAASPGISLLVAAHLTHSPESRRRVGELEAMGGALLEDETPASVLPDALDRTLARLDEAAAAEPAPAACRNGPLPRVVVEAAGCDFDRIPWRFRLPGVAEYEIAEENGERISLLRVRPGARIPQHTHDGVEMTLVLTGTMRDGGVDYGPGELAVNSDDDDHKPEIVGDEICYCLVVMSGRMRFTGPFLRAFNVLGP